MKNITEAVRLLFKNLLSLVKVGRLLMKRQKNLHQEKKLTQHLDLGKLLKLNHLILKENHQLLKNLRKEKE